MDVVNNVEVVELCFMLKKEWDIVVCRKNCSKLVVEVERENCIMNKKEFEYYCFINVFRNKFLEFCVFGKFIFGK